MMRIETLALPLLFLAPSSMCAQTAISTSGYQWSKSHPVGLAQNGPVGIQGTVGWTPDGSAGSAEVSRLFTPNSVNWGKHIDDAEGSLAHEAKIATPEFQFEYITLSDQYLKLNCRVLRGGGNSGAFYSFMDHYEPGKGYRILRNGVLIHQENFEPQPLPPVIEISQNTPGKVAWRIQRTPQLPSYQVRISWDQGHSWKSRDLKDNSVELTIDRPSNNQTKILWIEFQISQGFILTTRRYQVGDGSIVPLQ